MSSFFKDLLGDSLVKRGAGHGSLVSVSTDEVTAKADFIGLYFSAHWCMPCRLFTPQLAKFYYAHKDQLKLEIIFISSDKKQSEFNTYFAKQPWLSLPYSERHRKDIISTRCGVSRIPSFVLFDAKSGEMLTTEGRQKVAEAPNGDGFPWKVRGSWVR